MTLEESNLFFTNFPFARFRATERSDTPKMRQVPLLGVKRPASHSIMDSNSM